MSQLRSIDLNEWIKYLNKHVNELDAAILKERNEYLKRYYRGARDAIAILRDSFISELR